MNILVLGGGSAAFATVADLALRGHSVRMYSARQNELAPLREAGGVEATGEISGFAPIDMSPRNLGELMEWANIALLNVSAVGWETYSDLIVKSVSTDISIVSFGKGGASLILKRVAQESEVPHIKPADGNSSLYLSRRTDGAKVWIGKIQKSVTIAALPVDDTKRILSQLKALFPDTSFVSASNVVEIILMDYNAMLHPGPVICNASVVERAVSDFRLFSEESLTPSVVEIVAALDNERLSLCKAFGIDAMKFEQEFHRLGMVEEGTALRDCLHIDLLSQLSGPFSLKERHLDEDVPFGLVAWCAIGELLGVDLR